MAITAYGDLMARDIDAVEIEIKCPRCSFANSVRLGQVRTRDVVICRGCRCNIQLDDDMNSVQKARENIEEQLNRFKEEIRRINRKMS